MTSLDPLSRWTGVTEAINIFIKWGPLAMLEAFLRLMFVPHYYSRAALVHFLVAWQPSSALCLSLTSKSRLSISHNSNKATVSHFVRHRKLITLYNCY